MQIKTTVRYSLMLICKNKKVWQKCVDESVGATRVSDMTRALTWQLHLISQTLGATSGKKCVICSCPLHMYVKLKWVHKTVIALTTCSVHSLFILFHNELNCFPYPLLGYKPHFVKHSFQKYSFVNKETWARLFVASSFPINKEMNKLIGCICLRDD